MKRPSLFYRIKSIQGEELNILLVADTFGNKNYDLVVKGVIQDFRYDLSNLRQKMKVSNLLTFCSEKFKVNGCNGPDNEDCQNMCNFIPKLYGGNG